MTSPPNVGHFAEFSRRPVLPLLELGAYEALWDQDSASFKSIAALFQAHEGAIPSDFIDAGTAMRYAEEAVAILRKAGVERFGVRVHGAGDYPQRLRDAWHPIELLYYQGRWNLVDVPRAVAVVGTRNPSADGIRRARRLVKELARDDFVVVSGLAKGVDTTAHKTAIEEGGPTIAVIGTPLSGSYPRENAGLQRYIADQHLLISQIPVIRSSKQTYRGNRLFFPERNVTMSALTEATIIVEAGETSGTLTQARAALAQKRKLFILDSCFRNPALTWPARFEQQGAIRVFEYDDIKRELG
jgi:DNA processing protein